MAAEDLRVRMFGNLCVQQYDQEVLGFSARKVQELFCYLLLHRDHSHPREILANLLWNDCSTSHSKAYLRKALWQLQSELASQSGCMLEHMFIVEPDWVQMNPSADLWVDVAIFEQAYHC